MDIVFTKDQRKKDRARFDGNTLAVYSRDNYTCVNCAMTMEAHLLKYGKRLTINHINGEGRNSVKADNRMENLETVCLRCHGYRDAQNKKWLASKGNPINRRLV